MHGIVPALPKARQERQHAGGFALLEVLVAFVIAALALGVLTQGALVGLQAAHRAGRYESALSRTRSHLAAIGRGGGLKLGEQQGDDGGGFTWRTRVALLATAPIARGDAATVAHGPHIALYAVAVAMAWRDGGHNRVLELHSERIGVAPPANP